VAKPEDCSQAPRLNRERGAQPVQDALLAD
jgi:hypothetical protein